MLQEIVRRIHDGAIGEIVALHAARYGSGVWVRPRRPEMTEMVYQMLNWYYFTWLSVDLKQGSITGAHPWQAPRRGRVDSHQLEQDAFLAALRAGRVINNGRYMAHSTMMAIVSRMSAYTGRSLTWQQAINSREDLSPSGYTWDAEPPKASVAVPGVTRFV